MVGGFGPEVEPARTGVTPGVRSKIARRGVRSMQAAAEPIHVQVRLQRDSQAIFLSQINMGELGQVGAVHTVLWRGDSYKNERMRY